MFTMAAAGDVGEVGNQARDAHLQVLEHPVGIVDAPDVEGQALAAGQAGQAVGDHGFLHGQKVDFILPHALVQIAAGGVSAVAHPPLGMGLLQGGHTGVILGHEQEGLPHAGRGCGFSARTHGR